MSRAAISRMRLIPIVRIRHFYYFGLPYAGLNAVIDADSGESILFGDEPSIDHIVWMGTQPTLHEKAHNVGVEHVMTSDSLRGVL